MKTPAPKVQKQLASLAQNAIATMEHEIAGAKKHMPAVRRLIINALWKQHQESTRQKPEMHVPGSAKRIVVFLGAGASFPLGYPLTDGLLKKIWNGLYHGGWEKWAGFNRKRGKKKEPLPDRADSLRNFLCSVVPGLPEAGADTSGASIVDVISMLEHCITERHSPVALPKRPAPRALRRRSAAMVRQAATPVQPAHALIRIRHLLTMALNGVLQGQKKPDLRTSLAAWMVKRAFRGGTCRVTLLSTNYDTAIEKAVFNQLAARKHADERSVSDMVDFGFTWRDASGPLRARRPEAPLAVLKLHGSLNWLRCETCGHVTINPDQRIASLDFWETQNQYNTCECGGLLKCLLVTPSVVRDIRDPSLLAVWNAAVEDLRKADEWIMIGYSLPSEDVAIRSLLLRAFHARVNKGLKVRVVSFDSDEPRAANSTRAVYQLFFPSANFKPEWYEHRGAEVFINHLRRSRPKQVIKAKKQNS